MLFKKTRPIVEFIFEGNQPKGDSPEVVIKLWKILSKECKKSFESVLFTGNLHDFIGRPKIIFSVDKSIAPDFEILARKVCQKLCTELQLDASIHNLSEMD